MSDDAAADLRVADGLFVHADRGEDLVGVGGELIPLIESPNAPAGMPTGRGYPGGVTEADTPPRDQKLMES